MDADTFSLLLLDEEIIIANSSRKFRDRSKLKNWDERTPSEEVLTRFNLLCTTSTYHAANEVLQYIQYTVHSTVLQYLQNTKPIGQEISQCPFLQILSTSNFHDKR